jgi:hypothetical protein
MNVASMSNTELDSVALLSEGVQGEHMLAAVCTFLGRFIAHPCEHSRTAQALLKS